MLKIKQVDELQEALDAKVDVESILESTDLVTDPDWTGASDDFIPTQLAIKDFVEFNFSSGDAIDIGLPSDGDYLDGYYNNWTANVKISDALDDLNVGLLDVASDPAGDLSGDLVGPTLFSGKFSNGLPNAAQWMPDGILPGDTLTNITDGASITLTQDNLSTSFDAGRKFDYPSDLSGKAYAWKVSGAVTFPGIATSERDLSDTTGGVGTTGILEIIDISIYEDLHVKANTRIVDSSIVEGYNQYKLSADNVGETNTFPVYYTGVSFPDQSFSVNPSVTENTIVLNRLSGVDYYGVGSTFNVTYTADELYSPVYAVANQSVVEATYFNTTNVNKAGIPNYNDQLVVNEVLTVLSNLDTGQIVGDGTVTLYKPNKTDVVETFSIGTKPINTHSVLSTAQIEYFLDENKRYESHLIQSWDSNNVFTDTEAQLETQNGRLIDPRHSGNYPTYTATTNYYRRYFAGRTVNIDKGTLNITKSATLGEATKWLNTGGSKFQATLWIYRNPTWTQYDLGLEVGLTPGDGGIGIKDGYNSSEGVIKWALPFGETAIKPSDLLVLDIKFENTIATDYIEELEMVWSWD
jgi:hypothetical protein